MIEDLTIIVTMDLEEVDEADVSMGGAHVVECTLIYCTCTATIEFKL